MFFEFSQSTQLRPRKLDHCHVIVCGNEKGGSGKSTTAMHIAVALLRLGFRVATVDLDTRQQSLTRYNQYRRRWIQRSGEDLETSSHYCLQHEIAAIYESDTAQTSDAFDSNLEDWRGLYDFIVIDTPGSYTKLSTAAHRRADTLVTPVNDSFMDFDVLANIDPETLEIKNVAQYALSVREARRYRRSQGDGILDWIVLRNRMSSISSRNERRVDECLRELSMQLGFRFTHGIAERVVFRESFFKGLTALDETEGTINGKPLSMSHLTARNEVRSLISAMRLPIDKFGLQRAATRKQWLSRERPVIKVPDIFAD